MIGKWYFVQAYFYLTNLIYGLVKQTFWDHVKEEARSIWETITDFFLMIKEYTYDIIADKIGNDMAGVFLVAIICVGVMVVLITVINR